MRQARASCVCGVVRRLCGKQYYRAGTGLLRVGRLPTRCLSHCQWHWQPEGRAEERLDRAARRQRPRLGSTGRGRRRRRLCLCSSSAPQLNLTLYNLNFRYTGSASASATHLNSPRAPPESPGPRHCHWQWHTYLLRGVLSAEISKRKRYSTAY